MSHSYTIAARIIIEAESEQQAQVALDAIERAAERVAASVNVYVEDSGEVDR